MDTGEEEAECSGVLGVTVLQGQLRCSLGWSTKTWIAILAVSVREASGMAILSKPGGLQKKGTRVEARH